MVEVSGRGGTEEAKSRATCLGDGGAERNASGSDGAGAWHLARVDGTLGIGMVS